ncbi:VirK/YbjX family protein [uncultured Selenomonas sp.]|uniref:VirK/YbjX family protein n=1 Tax=uncultured Selenomonas sp. TaxID=159275 RepID=UPI0028E618B4|nr:VirK/YbjX family protein [uncultured Selenomonas sp.]
MQSFWSLGKKIYNMSNPREARRCVVFCARAMANRSRMRQIDAFFHQDAVLQQVADVCPFVYEQPTRAFFYHRSTFKERAALVEAHIGFLHDVLDEQALLALYRHEPMLLWRGESCMEKEFTAFLVFEPGQRKEGLLSVMLRLGESALYQIIFWINQAPNGEMAMWIGAMQGPNMENAKDVVKQVTKACHAYRTKNLILYMAQAVARPLQLKHIYAVSNEGYYANNHIRRDRKLKTDFGAFWEEAGGHVTEDSRFYELPLVETRKTMEEVPTRKRAVYRRRFAFLDDVDAQIAENMGKMLKV